LAEAPSALTLPFSCAAGTFAGYISISEKLLARMPSALSFEHAASLPLVAITAYQAGHSAPYHLDRSQICS